MKFPVLKLLIFWSVFKRRNCILVFVLDIIPVDRNKVVDNSFIDKIFFWGTLDDSFCKQEFPYLFVDSVAVVLVTDRTRHISTLHFLSVVQELWSIYIYQHIVTCYFHSRIKVYCYILSVHLLHLLQFTCTLSNTL